MISKSRVCYSPKGAIVSARSHHAIFIHRHGVHNGLLTLQHVVQKLTLHTHTHTDTSGHLLTQEEEYTHLHQCSTCLREMQQGLL